MKSALTIIKKEFSRFFKDKRMIATIFLPGILIFALYSIIGSFTADFGKVDGKPSAVIINMPVELEEPLSLFLQISEENINEEDAKKMVEDGTIDVLAVFPEDFDIFNTEIKEVVPIINIF